eukprot:scaffold4473_cov421-Prasinococcus_capsulatus_cf.AAC.5
MLRKDHEREEWYLVRGPQVREARGCLAAGPGVCMPLAVAGRSQSRAMGWPTGTSKAGPRLVPWVTKRPVRGATLAPYPRPRPGSTSLPGWRRYTRTRHPGN